MQPLGNRCLLPAADGASGHIGFQRTQIAVSARRRCGTVEFAASQEVCREHISVSSCQLAASGHQSHLEIYSRGQSRGTGPHNGIFRHPEGSSKYSLGGPAYSGVNIQILSTKGGSHVGQPRAGSVFGTGSLVPLNTGNLKVGSSLVYGSPGSTAGTS